MADPDPIEPVADPAPVEAVVAADPAPADPPAAVEPEPAPAPKPAPQMVPVTVVAELRGKARSLESELAQARREAADARALAERLAKGEKAEPIAPAPKAATAPAGDDAVRTAAERIVFERDVAAVRDAGVAQYGAAQFNDTIRALAAYGADDDAFVSQALGVARSNSIPAHQLLHDLAQDGEKTVALLSMTPTQRIAELTRMAMAAAAPKVEPKKEEPKVDPKPAPAISKAPTPKPAISPVAAAPEVDPRTPEGNEKMTDAEFEAWYKKTYMKKTA